MDNRNVWDVWEVRVPPEKVDHFYEGVAPAGRYKGKDRVFTGGPKVLTDDEMFEFCEMIVQGEYQYIVSRVEDSHAHDLITWAIKFPLFCRTCGATGVETWTENGAPHGEGYWPMPMTGPCPECGEAGDCPLCGNPCSLNEDFDKCSACDWTLDDGPFAPGTKETFEELMGRGAIVREAQEAVRSILDLKPQGVPVVKKISKCSDCPFAYQYNEDWGEFQCVYGYGGDLSTVHLNLEAPDWCPLRKRSLHLEFEHG